MKMKRWISSLLVAAMLAGIIITGPLTLPAAAASSASADSDALSALGIDTSKAPDGYDENSTENPYGRNTIAMAPVYELYTVGLNKTVIPQASGTNTAANTLQGKLYGDKQWGVTDSSTILNNNVVEKTLAAGNTTVTSTNTTIGGNNYLTGSTNTTTKLSDGTTYAMADVAAGKFVKEDKNAGTTLQSQIAMVYAGNLTKNAGLYLRFGDAVSGVYGDPITLLSTDKTIGNPTLTLTGENGEKTDKLAENFAENPYQLKNYLQVATGDWNGDGLDEVAVYIPEVGNSRIVVYALQLEANDKENAYQQPGKWGVAWTYYLAEDNNLNVVSNMVSLVSGDVDQDGIDDLSAAWGYYYGPTQNKGSKAVVMFGGKDKDILKRSQQFDLTYGSSNIVRASFAFGDITSSDQSQKTLVLCGQSDADLKAGNQNTRYVALYAWNGKSFTASVNKNFDLFEKDKDGNYVNSPMATGHKDKDGKDVFYSLPLCPANTAIIGSGAGKGADLLYFDSLIIGYGDSGLTIQQAWDNTDKMPGGSGENYVEYDAAAGDLTGTKGAGTLFTMTQTMSDHPEKTAEVSGTRTQPKYKKITYYKNWFYRLLRRPSYFYMPTGEMETVSTTEKIPYTGYTPEKTYFTAVNPTEGYKDRKVVNNSYTLCLANTDNDSSYMTYTGNHRYTYTDPQVLAVLASPPYFADLLDRDDLSGNYAESSTTYSSTKGSETSTTQSSTITAGVYVSFEQEFSVFGVKVASAEAEATVTAGFTWETEHTASLEQTVTYTATSGENQVAFYSIPMEIYEYKSYVPNGKGGYDEVLTAVNIPHEACIKLLNLEDYEEIAKDYSVLPSISGNVLKHTLGDPGSYPSSAESCGFPVIAQYTGTPAAVGFTSAGGGAAISQEISMSESNSTSFTKSASIEAKAGAGAGGVTVGVVAGSENGAGSATVSTNGSSFSGELQNMPAEAQAYGYGMNWKIFCYKYSDGKMEFPVVSYIVSDVSKPAPLPTDFGQNVAATTSNSVTLEWSYDKLVTGFQLYRYYDFPDGSGSYELKYVPFTSGEKNADGTYHFTYTDTGLSPYTEYQYQIRTESANNPKYSIYSEPISCRTKTDRGYPKITTSGLVDGVLPIYPDAQGEATVSIENASLYGKNISYQWQKKDGGTWTDISGATTEKLTITNASAADQGTYRCRVNVLYNDSTAAKEFSISAYSQEFQTAYSKRTPASELTVTSDFDQKIGSNVIHAKAEFHSANQNNSTAPTGTVTFIVSGTDYEYSKTVALEKTGENKKYGEEIKDFSQATVDITVPGTKGAYTVKTYYSGNRIFKDEQNSEGEMIVIGDATGYRLTLSKTENGKDSVTKFIYGDAIYPTLYSKTANEDETEVTAVTYQLKAKENPPKFTAGTTTTDVGKYTLQAVVKDKVVAEVDIEIQPRPVTISVADMEHSTKDLPDNLPAISGSGISGEELKALKLTYTVQNSAGNITELNAATEPGNYVVTPCKSATTPEKLYGNYEITYRSGTYHVIGVTYLLNVSAEEYKNGETSKVAGTAAISATGKTSGSYVANTEVQLYAEPFKGYMVDYWTVQRGNNDEEKKPADANNPNRLTLKTDASAATVRVYFKPKSIILKAYTDQGGEVKCSDAGFASGATVATGISPTFTAVPAAGYHFKQWQLGVTGSGTTYPEGTKLPDGSNTLQVTVGEESITLKAVFERDNYTVTLNGDITAWYMKPDLDPTKPAVKTEIHSGDKLQGDTKITVEPKSGYQAANDATFVLNDVPTDKADKYEFELKTNSTVSLKTQRNAYELVTNAEHGTILVTVNGEQTETLTGIPGGSAVTFTARAKRGYHFVGWKIGEETSATTGDVLAIPALGSNLTVTALFEQSDPYTVTGTVTPANRGSLKYTLYDIYGNVVGEEKTPLTETLTVYKDEKIQFFADVNSGSTVEQWVCNGKTVVTTSNCYPTEAPMTVEKSITVEAKLTAAYSYNVAYAGDGNGTVTATADGIAFESKNTIFGGSKAVFTATPKEGYMVDYWTVTMGDLNTAENTARIQVDGLNVIDPVYTIDSLVGNQVIRAHFTVKKAAMLTLNEDAGTAKITYATPIQPNVSSVTSETTAEIRANGTVVLELKPADNYTATAKEIQTKLAEKLNDANAKLSVTEENGTFTVTVRNLTLAENLTIKASDLFTRTYVVNVPAHVTATPAKAKAGETVTLKVTPESGMNLKTLEVSGGKLNREVSAGTLTYTFKMPAKDVTVTATFEKAPVFAGGGGGGGGAVAPKPETGNGVVTAPDGSALNAEVTVIEDTAEVTMDPKQIENLTGSISGSIEIDLTKEETVTKIQITGELAAAIGEKSTDGMTIHLKNGGLTLDRKTLETIAGAAKDDGTVEIRLEPAEWKALLPVQKDLLPAGSITWNVSVTVMPKNGIEEMIHMLGGAATVTVPYELKEDETAENVAVYYIADDGTVEKLESSYDTERLAAVFETEHFSTFAVVHEYSKKFNDVNLGSWYYEAINTALKEKWFSGVSDTEFQPDETMTRAMLVTVLYNLSESNSTKTHTGFADVDPNAWYAKAVAWAAENKIVEGYDGLFHPNDPVTRQQMASILYRYDLWAGNVPSVHGNLTKFTDADSVAAWAKNAMIWATDAGLIRGAGDGMLMPNGNATRAQVAVILKNYYAQRAD